MFESPNQSAREVLSPRPVLVVDDDPLVGRAMSALMTKAGFQAIVCVNGSEALSHCGGKQQIAAAIVDIHLPDINGITLAQQMRDRFDPSTPIVILSGDHSMDTIRALPDTASTYFIAKPVNGNRLIEQLKEWISAA
jgi:DNA-binding response OmpR family regulator